METCSLIHDRISFRAAVVVVLVIGTFMFATPAGIGLGASATAQAALTQRNGNALTKVGVQTTNDASQTKSGERTQTQSQEPIPPDHYDPDDIRTYADVSSEDDVVTIHGQPFTVHFYRPRKDGAAIPAIYACGDGGWRGLAPRTGQQLAHMGFAVAGIDSKVYLRDFSSLTSPLTIKQLASDYSDIALRLRAYAQVQATTPVYVYGWSLGAGFAIAVGTDETTRSNWAGIISIGLPRQNQLVSGIGANHTNLSSELNTHYGFRSQDLMASITPLPLVMIQSTSDTASPPKVGQALFTAAKDPKRYVLIKASNHRFTGARDEFYAALGDAVSWMRDPAVEVKSSEISQRKHALEP
jgi:dienelactone hydrolase